jgi:hypothetical protein
MQSSIAFQSDRHGSPRRFAFGYDVLYAACEIALMGLQVAVTVLYFRKGGV